MARYSTRPRTSNQLRAQLLNQIENEAQKLIKQMLNDFSSTLANESQRVMKESLGSLSGGDGLNGTSLTKILSTAVSYAMSKPRITTSTSESTRSINTDTAFRLSRAQAAAEAASSLARGQRNR